MRKSLIPFILLLTGWFNARADHITGGEMYYSYRGQSNGLHSYEVTLKLYMRCNSGRQFNNPTTVAIFDRATGGRVQNVTVPLARTNKISLSNPDPCITNPPTVCYDVGYFEFSISLPPSSGGYIIAAQANYRVGNIRNLILGYSQIGATYTAEIPGIGQANTDPENHSAQFVGNDLVVVCSNNSFTYSFAAQDADKDSLRYSFCDAYQSSSTGNNAPPSSSNFSPVPYGPGFSGSAPLGMSVSVNPRTGLISGVAPLTGIYIVTVCVQEIRNGRVIASQRKDLQINIAPCTVAGAVLEPDYLLCRDSKTIALVNLSTSPLIKTYSWEIIDANGNTLTASSNPAVSYTFPDTGTYSIKLLINRGQPCSDSTSSIARVYPGFSPQFDHLGVCVNKPTVFTDRTTSVYGTANKWSWNFGDINAPDNISNEKNPAHTYSSNGSRNVVLSVSSSVGCRDTISKVIDIVSKPPLNVAFSDTLICVNDVVQLKASGTGLFSWSPDVDIVNANSATPTASPFRTTKYYVNLNDNGCINNDSVVVRVTDHVNLQAMNDTTICSGDSIRLTAVSDGFKYLWQPANLIRDPTLKNSTAITPSTTTYQLTAFIGSCSATDNVVVTTVPYPVANAGADTTICFNSSATLHGSANGSSFTWLPSSTLVNSQTLTPIANPATTTSYILLARDNKGCPKPGLDTMVVTVLPDIKAFAGRDTAVVVGQPLHFNAASAFNYKWSPAFGLSSNNIQNPVGLYKQPSEGLRYKLVVSNEAGCLDSAYVTVKVFAEGPNIFVPTAFTPNNDGRNDVLRPIAAGIKQIELFDVYNRWGQLVFRSQASGKGWDGTTGGSQQGSGVFVWVIKAIDYMGKPYFKKGTVALIR